MNHEEFKNLYGASAGKTEPLNSSGNTSRDRDVEQLDCRADKPSELYIAISRMEGVSSRLEDLFTRLSGGDRPVPNDAKAPNYSCLLEVLNEGPIIISNHLEAQHDKISCIERIIFGS
jgi:hypothetical protein